MSAENSQNLFEDRGHRTAVANSGGRSEKSDVQLAAERSSPGAWDEDLGNWGSDDWQWPGEGESGSGCGEIHVDSVCAGCGHVDVQGRNCGKRTCPECWKRWARDAAIRAAVRIQAFRQTLPNNYERQAAHSVVSPPEGAVMNERQLREGRKKAKDIALEKGFRGVSVVAHPHRITAAGKVAYHAESPDCNKYDWVKGLSEDLKEEYRYWSPHYHVIGITTPDMGEGKDSDEWLYSWFRPFESYDGQFDLESHMDLYKCFRYLLSHAVGDRMDSIVWCGDLANNKFVEDAREDWQHEKPPGSVRRRIKRLLEDEVNSFEDDGGDRDCGVSAVDDKGECPVDDCGGVLIDVFDISAYLRQSDPPPEVRERMIAARDWRCGRIFPPPGLRNPSNQEDASEAVDALVGKLRM